MGTYSQCTLHNYVHKHMSMTKKQNLFAAKTGLKPKTANLISMDLWNGQFRVQPQDFRATELRHADSSHHLANAATNHASENYK